MVCTLNIAEQLTEIYFTEEKWHLTRMSPEVALHYHQERMDNGTIVPCIENGEVLGYYERDFIGNTCFLYNVWVRQDLRQGKVFKWLYRSFFNTMPDNIDKVIGNKQKLYGKIMVERITRRR